MVKRHNGGSWVQLGNWGDWGKTNKGKKMEYAKRSFVSSRKNINEVMYDVGYTDTKAFRTIFKKITGLTPVEYRNKYSKMAVQ